MIFGILSDITETFSDLEILSGITETFLDLGILSGITETFPDLGILSDITETFRDFRFLSVISDKNPAVVVKNKHTFLVYAEKIKKISSYPLYKFKS